MNMNIRNVTYSTVGDYQFPNLTLPQQEKALGNYGRLRWTYNELFNSSRPREYDGSHINFVGMNQEISLREHQRNAIAHVLYGGNIIRN